MSSTPAPEAQPLVQDVQAEIKSQTLKSTFAVSFYMLTSITLVFLNRFVLSDTSVKAGGLFTSWYQFVVAYIIIVLITTCCPNVPLLNLFPPLKYKWSTILKVVPVSIAYLLMIGFNNKCLEYMSISGYQIARALTILFNIILTYFILHEKTSLKAVVACLGVVLGFYLGIEGEINLSIKGAIFGVCSSIFVALYSIVVKRVMSLLDNSEYILIEYNTPIAIVFLLPFVIWSGEFKIVFSHPPAKFWVMQTLAGVVGFVINIAIFLDIKYTTPLTHNLTGTLKACIQTLLAFVFFPGTETMTTMKFIGTAMIIGFSGYYAYVRKHEMANKIAEKSVPKALEKASKALEKAPEAQEKAEKPSV